MCMQLNDWLSANLVALKAALQTTVPPPTLRLCVVLCSRECKSDAVPIASEPCMTQSSSMAPSRIVDSFDLMLCLDHSASPPISPPHEASPDGLSRTRPAQLEDDAVRALGRLMSEFEVSATGPFLTVEQVEQLVLDLAEPPISPPIASPPAGPPYRISRARCGRTAPRRAAHLGHTGSPLHLLFTRGHPLLPAAREKRASCRAGCRPHRRRDGMDRHQRQRGRLAPSVPRPYARAARDLLTQIGGAP